MHSNKSETDFTTDIESLQSHFKKRQFRIRRHQDNSEFPELEIIVPDSWPHVVVAPLFDVHLGSKEHDGNLFQRHLNWIVNTPYLISFNGGDAFDNLTPQQAVKMGQNPISPEEQLWLATETFSKIQHKMAFSLMGNHEFRSARASGIDSAKQLAANLKLPYFADYAFVTLRWRGNNFRILAHHGAGGGQTPGAQRNAARKDMAWTKADIVWTGHLHKSMADSVFSVDYDHAGRAFERTSLVLISPAYVKYFGGYGAAKRMSPDSRGLTAVTLNSDGRMDVTLHARGRRI